MFCRSDKRFEIGDKIKLPVKYSLLPPLMKRQVREQYIKNQNGRCFYCNNKFDEDLPVGIKDRKVDKSLFPNKFFDCPIHLHHCHDTDMTIGAVHAICNAQLWIYEGE